MMMNRLLRGEMNILLPTYILVGAGWVMVFSTAAMQGMDSSGAGVFARLQRQVVATILGTIALVAASRMNVAALARRAPPLLVATSVLMMMVFVPGLGKTVARATRWLDFGPVTFQPVEVFKIAVVLSYVAILGRVRAREEWPREAWLKIAGLAALSVLLPILQRDFGSAVLMLSIGASMIWLGGASLRSLAGFAGAAVIAAGGLLASAPYRLVRLKQYLSAWGSLDGGGYQTRQSLIALGAGGITGVGLGESGQKLFYLPQAHADFIFAIIGEEAGFLGAFGTLAMYVVLLTLGLGIAQSARTRTARHLAAGLSLLLFTQAIWHIAVALVLVPTKGLALPFVSYGGSSLLSSLLAVGLVLACSRKDPGDEVRMTGPERVGSPSWAGS